MSISTAQMWLFLLIFTSILQSTLSSNVTYDFNITWVAVNPDGAFTRPTIGVNGQWPPPQIHANLGDTITVNVLNLLGNQSTSLHFHGLFMNGSTHMDGPAQVSQCAIAPGSSFTYRFRAEQVGTYWYHSHTQSQYPDGLRAPLIIHDPDNPYAEQFDQELVLTVSDWYHQQMADLIPQYMKSGHMMSHEPVPDASLLNDTHDLQVGVVPGKTYLVRMVNMAAFAGQYFWIEGHTMTIVEIDGVYTRATEAEMIYLASGQRCSFLLTTKSQSSHNYPFVASMDQSLFMMAGHVNSDVTGWLVYDSAHPLPRPKKIDQFNPTDDMTIVPYDEMQLLPKADKSISLNLEMRHSQGATYYMFNDISYRSPEIPSLYTALTSGNSATDPAVYGISTNPFVLERNDVVELVLYNRHMLRHPFHLHGHHFQAIYRSEEYGGRYEDSGVTEANLPQKPIRRDTLVLPPGGSMVIRFRADNPGVWLFHCHMEWHVHTGLVATMIEAPIELQQQRRSQPLPADHIGACVATGTPATENDPGQVDDLLDVQNENDPTQGKPEGVSISDAVVSLAAGSVLVMTGLVFLVWFGVKNWGARKAQYAPLAMNVEEDL
ncbi:uncharacterized protein Z518_05551 [Rhinocladiella mackenziei CBS 650.93]|uniref:Rhinocladiella mackenziei CBS 650.93 unplaced genomic scaffold supercont1.4, whole genome shotgun sequence n=1 Tax=Rhinocladiella mackenziei CBS 650.93 TaxID=1442369 RepID=A0A0D2ING9_9EURO|nr:uncharacterized protein Z518_05551 [Rhinocladiella mackenziei CBS 650.93]KIX04681.1 hypothetical protein Z518_05551 [Rhinocladiella mackenziei CBS 650.93]